MSRSGRALLGVLALVPPSTVDLVEPLANTPPTVMIEAPADGGFAQPGEPLPFKVTVTDAEDGAVDCTKVVVTYGTQAVAPGPDCAGALVPEAGQGVHTFSARYTDAGALTGAAEVLLNPREHLAADHPTGAPPQLPEPPEAAPPPDAQPPAADQPAGANPELPPADGQQPGAAPAAGADPNQLPGADSGQSAGVDPNQLPGANSGQPAGVDPNQLPGANSGQPAGVDPNQLPGADSGQPAGVDPVPSPEPTQPPAPPPLPEQPTNWFVVPHVNLATIHHLAMELTATKPGATLTVHADSPTGPAVATFPPIAEPTPDYRWLAADVTDPVGAHDLYFVADGLSARYLRFQTIPAVAATIPPAPTGWHTTDVPVTLATAPLWDPQVSLDGGATWSPSPVVLAADGVYDLRYRAVDAAGRTSEPVAAPVRIDRTAPTVPVTREHPHTTTLELAATDTGSGVATLTATLDGTPVTGPVELWRYPAGVHQLTVTTTDVAGNTNTQATELEITTSLAELTPMLTRFPIPFVKTVILRLQLMAAERAVNAGRPGEAVTWVRAFLRSAAALRDPTTRAVLTGDAAVVATQLKS